VNQFSLWDLILAFVDQVVGRHPWVVGVLGWAGATVVWEGIVKRSSERRGLAYMLAQELMVNKVLAHGYLEKSEQNPGGIPADLHFSDVAFLAITARLGELPRGVAGPLIIYYDRIRTLNQTSKTFEGFLRRFQDLQKDNTTPMWPSSPALRLERRHLDATLEVYRRSLNALIEHSNELLPRLWRFATLGGRLTTTLITFSIRARNRIIRK
jgi:hypothetical protein